MAAVIRRCVTGGGGLRPLPHSAQSVSVEMLLNACRSLSFSFSLPLCLLLSILLHPFLFISLPLPFLTPPPSLAISLPPCLSLSPSHPFPPSFHPLLSLSLSPLPFPLHPFLGFPLPRSLSSLSLFAFLSLSPSLPPPFSDPQPPGFVKKPFMSQEFISQHAVEHRGRLICKYFLGGRCLKVRVSQGVWRGGEGRRRLA